MLSQQSVTNSVNQASGANVTAVQFNRVLSGNPTSGNRLVTGKSNGHSIASNSQGGRSSIQTHANSGGVSNPGFNNIF